MLMLLKNKTQQALGVLVRYHVALSDEVKLCCASRPLQREGWLRVIFTVFLKVTVCVFTFVHITGRKAANSAIPC